MKKLAFALLFLAACSSAPKTTDMPIAQEPAKTEQGAPAEYTSALSLLNAEKYEDAYAAFQAFVKAEPASPYTQIAIYNAAFALEKLQRWTEASQTYRSVIRATDTAPRLQALALYRLSFCHEALGEDQQTVATLVDLKRRRDNLPPEVGAAELPARLAGAYARVGNFDEASKNYQEAYAGIAHLRRESKGVPEWLPRTLYSMGTLPSSRVQWVNFEIALRPLAHAQLYLLQVAELGVAPWSEKASKDLISTYSDLWRAIELAPVPEGGDQIIARRETQVQQWDRAILVLESLQELKARALAPEDKSASPDALKVADFAGALEKKIRKLLDQRPVGEGLTAEAAARRLRVRGKVVSPDATLERQFLRDAQAAKPLPGTTDVPDQTEKPALEDPNL